MITKMQFGWAAVSISLTASVVLFGIWRRGYPNIEKSTQQKEILYDDGIMWIFLACMLWTFTSIVELFLIHSSRENNPPTLMAYINVLLSLSNSLCFVLATANLDELKDSSTLDKFLTQIRGNVFRIWIFIIVFATILWRIKPYGGYYQIFDVLASFLAIFLITWGFSKSFWRRNFPIVALLSIVVFSIFMVAQLRELLDVNFLASHLRSALPWLEPWAGALSVAADGMVSLLFIAMVFSFVHEKTEELTDEIEMLYIPAPNLREVKGSGT